MPLKICPETAKDSDRSFKTPEKIKKKIEHEILIGGVSDISEVSIESMSSVSSEMSVSSRTLSSANSIYNY